MEVIEFGANNTIVLDDPQIMYLVQAGTVEVYAAKVIYGEPSAYRMPLFQAEIGQALFGIDRVKYNSEIVLMVSGGSTHSRLEKRNINQMTEKIKKFNDKMFLEPFIYFIENWILGLSSAVVRKVAAPKRFEILSAGSQLEVTEGGIIRPKQDIVWVRLLRGSSKYLGQENLSCSVEDGWFPLPEDFWVTAEDSCHYQAELTEALLDFADDPESVTLYHGIDIFHQTILTYLEDCFRARELKQANRLKEKERNEAALVKGAFSRLASVMDFSPNEFSGKSGGDPLFQAVQMIGNATGIAVRSTSSYAPNREGLFNLQALRLICQASQFKFHKVVLKEYWWKKDNGPLLAVTDKGHAVALIPQSPGSYKFINPVSGETGIVSENTALTFVPGAYMFFRPLPSRALTLKDILVFCIKSAWASDLALLLLMGASVGGLGLLTPVATGMMMEDIIPSADQASLVIMGSILLISVLVGSMFSFVQSISHIRAEGWMNLSLQLAIWDRILGLPPTFFRNMQVGDLASRILGVNAMRQMLSGAAVSALQSSVFSAFNLGLLFVYDMRLALVAIGIVFTYLLFVGVNSYFQFCFKKEMMNTGGNLSALIWQIMGGVTKLRISGTENRAYVLWAKQFALVRSIGVKARKNNFVTFVSAGLNAIVLMVIFYFTSMFEVKTANYMAFSAAFSTYITSMVSISSVLASIIDIGPLYLRTQPILKAVPEVMTAKRDPGDLTGDIFVSHAYFRYHANSPYVLRDVSFRVKKGEYVAFIGPSGCGKSTLVRLLLGFERPQGGNVLYDGQDLNDINIQFVRAQLGVVLQNSQLMTGDILHNIIGTSNLTVEDAWQAAAMAGIDEDIRQMPMGMYTMISEGATTISGGQRQRLLIARALLKRPRIIIFDEATSALDNETQAVVINSLENLKATRIIIAHRLSTIRNADRIITMDNGQIVQMGTYEALMSEEGLFRELARRQLA